MAAQGGDGGPQFHIGSLVASSDGRFGRVRRVVVDPETGRVVDLVVSLGGGEDREVVLPVDRVLSNDARQVTVGMLWAEMEALPPFEAVRFRRPDVAWPGLPSDTPDAVLYWAPRAAVEAFVPPSILPEPNVEGYRNVPGDSVILSADLDVRCGLESVGHVDRVLVDAREERATHLVVRSGLLGTDERVVPVSEVLSVTDDTVELDCQGRNLDRFPRYRE